MKINVVIVYALLLTFSSNWVLGQDLWKIDSARVVFHIVNAGLNVVGTIAGVSGEIKFSQTNSNTSLFVATAKPETIQTGLKLRDKHLKKADYFDVENYPTIHINSKQISMSKGVFKSLTTLTVKGITKNIVMPFTFKQVQNKAEFKGSFSLNRLDFGLGEKSIILSDTVRIDIWVGTSLVAN